MVQLGLHAATKEKISAVAGVVKVWDRWLWPLGHQAQGAGRQGSRAGPTASRGELTSCCRAPRPFSASTQVRKHMEPQAKPVFQSLPNVPSVVVMTEVGLNPKDKTRAALEPGVSLTADKER